MAQFVHTDLTTFALSRRRRQAILHRFVMASRFGLLAVVLTVACSSAVAPPLSVAQPAPPPGSPTALGMRPRLFFTSAQVPGIRQRLADHYKAEFQQLLDRLADPSRLTSGQRNIESDWGSLNAAFVAVLGPQELSQAGFNVAGSIDTPQKLCGKAMAYASKHLADIAAAKSLGHSSLTTGYPTARYIPVAAAYDWCNAHLSSTDKQAIADAFVSMFNRKYKGKNPLTMEVSGLNMLANNQSSVNVLDIIGAVALWGESYPALDVQQAMYGTFSSIWLTRITAELQALYGEGTSWHEGPGGYFTEGFMSLGIGFGAIAPAIGQPLPAQMPFFTRLGEFVQGVVKPISLKDNCGSGSARCPRYYERWGTISGGIAGPSCLSLMLGAGLLRTAGADSAAGLVKYAIDTTRGNCTASGTTYGGVWSNGVLEWFIFGDRGIKPLSPEDVQLPSSLRHGLGLYTLRSGYGPDDSQVVFFAPRVGTYGHGSPDYGTFTLHKHGNLIVQAGNGKSGDGALSIPSGTPSLSPLVRNVLSLHKGATDHNLSMNGAGAYDPTLAAIGVNELRGAGVVRAEHLNGSGFDYVSYDLNERFTSGTASVAQREMVYLRGPEDHEYLLVFDRFNAVKPQEDEKVWRIWVPTEPEFLNGSAASLRAGKLSSSSSDTIRVTNEGGPFSGNNYSSGPTSGRFFMKTLWPGNPVINFIGGAGMEYQSAQDDGSTPWGVGKQTATTRQYLGIGRVEVRPSVSQAYDIFLNVLQFGNAKSLTQMAPVTRLEAGTMVGSYIRDPANSWVVLFARDDWPATPRSQVSYSVQATAPTSRHLLVNMVGQSTLYVNAVNNEGNLQVDVSTTPNGGAPVKTSDAGAVYFEVNGQSVYAPSAPDSPKHLRAMHD